MDMFVFSYVNELCIYLRLCLSSSWFCLRLRTNKDSTNLFYSYIVLIYVNETIYVLGNFPFFNIHVNRFMVWVL